jgi:hypothetical protein
MIPSNPLNLLTAAAVAATLAALAPAARADDCVSMDAVIAHYANEGTPIFLIPPGRLPTVLRDTSEITRQTFPFVSRGFLVAGKSSLVLGFESGGCLLAPVVLDGHSLQAMA